ncbi:glutathione S-transferase family protein [Paraburkholderia largidicola]|uniref:Thiol:disulfide oxidoreductase n=1 Tax=Paraburkholderia largidicola TaxID=3014751 RepID=A0A7I8C1Y2_9BURK|nr:glutathione S-transferase N-terminal domain-containing protein [Paraburkholderia sp. PGU16]BCF95086.1 thiol:disulfide oxidoreductase [Paraburkholderia sp. PGU16]
MLKVFAFSTPNSVRIPIALEELGLEYEIEPINVRKGEQKWPNYLAINPNGKVPVLVDNDGPGGEPITLTESGAILIYLAEKAGRLLPSAGAVRARTFEQLLFHLTAIGPALGQLGFFKRQASEEIPVAIARFQTESDRVLAVLDRVLAQRQYAAGGEFTIADIAHFGWLWRREFAGVNLDGFPNIERWYRGVEGRPAVQRGIQRVTALVPTD